MLHGIYLAISVAYKPYQKKVHRFFKIDPKSIFHKVFCVFFIFNLVSLAWIFFRTSSIKDAFFCIKNIYEHIPVTLYKISLDDFLSRKIDFSLGYGYYELMLCVVFIVFIGFYDLYIKDRILEAKLLFRWSFYYVLLVSIVFFSVSNIKKDFLYLAF